MQRLLGPVVHGDIAGRQADGMVHHFGGVHGLVQGLGGHFYLAGKNVHFKSPQARFSRRERRNMAMALSTIIRASNTMMAADVRASKKFRFSLPCQR